MSIKVMTEVWDSSRCKGSTLLLMLALADHADDLGRCYPGHDSIAAKMRLAGDDKKTRNRNLSNLIKDRVEAGELVYIPGNGRGHESEFWVLPPATVTRLRTAGKNDANFAPFTLLKKGAENDTVKGANSDTVKGAGKDTKGCKKDHQRVQKNTLKGANSCEKTPDFPAPSAGISDSNRQEPSYNRQGTVSVITSSDDDTNPQNDGKTQIPETLTAPSQDQSDDTATLPLEEQPEDVEEVPGAAGAAPVKLTPAQMRHGSLRDAWNAHRGTLPYCDTLNGERRRLMDALLKDAGSIEDAVRMLALAARVVSRDDNWNGTKDGKKYGLTNLLRHVPSYSEKATAADYLTVTGAVPEHLQGQSTAPAAPTQKTAAKPTRAAATYL